MGQEMGILETKTSIKVQRRMWVHVMGKMTWLIKLNINYIDSWGYINK